MAYTQKIKIYFSIIFIILVSAMIAGIFMVKRFYFDTTQYLKTAAIEIEYQKYIGEETEPVALSVMLSPFRALKNTWVVQGKNGKTGETATSVPVLIYHGILKDEDASGFNISIDKFKDQMFALKKAGYETITSETLYKYMKEGLELPEKSIVITFDDGRLDSLYNGNPTLKALDYQAIMFVITAYSLSEEGSSYYINGNQLIQMEKTGIWDVQAHTEKGHDSPVTGPDGLTGHFFSHKLWLEEEGRLETEDEFRERASDDLDKAKDRLSALLNKEIIAFAFPFGDFGQHATNFSGAKDILLEFMEEKYRLGFFQDAPGFRFSENYPATDSENNLAMIRRIDINPSWSGDELLDRLKQSQAKSLPYTDDFPENNGWIAAWGNIDIASSQMSISPKLLTAGPDAQTGGATILDGTRAWKNYEISMTLEVPNLNSAFIWARFRDDENNASCNFGNGFAHAEQIINGEQRVLRGIRGPEITIPRGEFEARVKVEGRHISCFINNRLVVESYFMDENLDSGGIGFKTWDPEIGRSILLVKKITANEL